MGKSLNLELPAVSLPSGIPSADTIKAGFHVVQVLCIFITLCLVASVISTEMKFYGSSQPGPNWTLFCALFSLGVPIGLVVFPWIYKRNGKFRTLGKFCLKARTNLIFTGFYTCVWAFAGIAMTVHTNNESNCALFSDMQEEYGDDYANAWPTQCTNARVASGFSWTLCFLWLGSLVCALITLWKEKQASHDHSKKYEESRQNALQQKQQLDQEEYGIGASVEESGYGRQPGYYEDDEGEDLSHMRPQSFEQARPLNYTSSSPPAPHMQQSPFSSPYDQHIEVQQHHQQQYDPYPEQPHSAIQNTPFQDPHYGHYSPEQAHNPGYTAPSPPQGHPPGGYSPTPMPMPDPTHYHSQSPTPMHASNIHIAL